jgi:hypothetical protein
MAVTFQQSVFITGADRSPTFTLGTAPLENDVIYVFTSSGTTAAVTDPAEWTNILGANTDIETPAHQAMCHAHRVTNAEATASTVTWTLTNAYNTNETFSAIVAVYRDVSTSTLFEATETTQEDSATTVATIPALTPTVTNGRVLAFVSNDAGTATNTTPSGWTSRQTSSSSGRMDLYEWNTLTTATVDTSSASATGANDEKIVFAFVIPVAATPPPTTKSGWGIVA